MKIFDFPEDPVQRLLTYVITCFIIFIGICRKGELMLRPFRCSRIELLPVYGSFSPDDITAIESVQMPLDEFEALRLLDEHCLD